MTKIIHRVPFPALFSKDEFLTPFDRIFDEMIDSSFPGFAKDFGVDFFGKGSYPKVNITDHEDKIQILAEIAGMGKDEVSIEIEDSCLTISGAKHKGNENEDARYIRRELKHSSFKRSFTLGENLDADGVKAEFDNGTLAISIPKVEPEKPKKTFVEIK